MSIANDPDHTAIPPQYHRFMNELAKELDERFNPTLPGLPSGPKKIGFDYGVTLLENDQDHEELWEAYSEREDYTVIDQWRPQRDGWMLAAVSDSEEGPCAIFIRAHCPPTAAASGHSDGGEQ